MKEGGEEWPCISDMICAVFIGTSRHTPYSANMNEETTALSAFSVDSNIRCAGVPTRGAGVRASGGAICTETRRDHPEPQPAIGGWAECSRTILVFHLRSTAVCVSHLYSIYPRCLHQHGVALYQAKGRLRTTQGLPALSLEKPTHSVNVIKGGPPSTL